MNKESIRGLPNKGDKFGRIAEEEVGFKICMRITEEYLAFLGQGNFIATTEIGLLP